MVYSFEDVQATLAGPGGVASLGFGAAVAKEGISIDFVDPKNAMIIGADGQGVHSLRAGKAAKITIRLMKTSPQNAVLNQMYNTQIGSSLFWGQNVLTVTNPVTGDDYPCSEVAFEKFPAITWAEDPNMNEWVFDAIKADPILGVGI